MNVGWVRISRVLFIISYPKMILLTTFKKTIFNH